MEMMGVSDQGMQRYKSIVFVIIPLFSQVLIGAVCLPDGSEGGWERLLESPCGRIRFGRELSRCDEVW